MTVIIGLEDNGKVWMGGDRQSSDGYIKSAIADPKVFIRNGYILGFSGKPRVKGWIQSGHLALPSLPQEINPYLAVVNLVECLADKMQQAHIEDCPNYLVGYGGQLYGVDSLHSPVRAQSDFFATGSGWEVASGAMLALAHLPPFERISQALAITKTLAVGCGGDSDIISL